MYTFTTHVGRFSVHAVLVAIALGGLWRNATEEPAAVMRSAAPRPRGLAEIQFAKLPRASAAATPPALPGEPVPSRWSLSDRPIGWEAMLATRGSDVDAATFEPSATREQDDRIALGR